MVQHIENLRSLQPKHFGKKTVKPNPAPLKGSVRDSVSHFFRAFGGGFIRALDDFFCLIPCKFPSFWVASVWTVFRRGVWGWTYIQALTKQRHGTFTRGGLRWCHVKNAADERCICILCFLSSPPLKPILNFSWKQRRGK